MKGSPLIRLGVVLVILIAVLWPVYRLTNSAPLQKTEGAPEQSLPPTIPSLRANKPTLRATLLLHASPMPNQCQVTQGDRIILTEKNLVSPGEYRIPVELVKGMDLVIRATWGNEEPHAIRAEVLVHGYQQTLEKSFWAQGTLEDTLTIPSSFLP
ncbi:MAG: hypothetical protein DVB30_00510 [Verrucomicrobia bacterium]|nr:MAG: hypothetical protein DVB30_00510 [Verrucomicrobiota bacterium]